MRNLDLFLLEVDDSKVIEAGVGEEHCFDFDISVGEGEDIQSLF